MSFIRHRTVLINSNHDDTTSVDICHLVTLINESVIGVLGTFEDWGDHLSLCFGGLGLGLKLDDCGRRLPLRLVISCDQTTHKFSLSFLHVCQLGWAKQVLLSFCVCMCLWVGDWLCAQKLKNYWSLIDVTWYQCVLWWTVTIVKFVWRMTFTRPVSVAQWTKPLLNRPQRLLAWRADDFCRLEFESSSGSFSARSE